MKLIIVRHCKAASNAGVGFYGKGNYPLTSEGLIQSKKLARFLKDEHIDIIFSSPQERAYSTALEIAKERGIAVNKEELLREVDFGIFEGMTIEEAKIKMPETFLKRQSDKFGFRIPGGESYKSAYERAMTFINRISSLDDKTIVIVTHATMIKLLLMGLVGMSLEQAESRTFPPGSVTKLLIDIPTNSNVKIEVFNYTGYL